MKDDIKYTKIDEDTIRVETPQPAVINDVSISQIDSRVAQIDDQISNLTAEKEGLLALKEKANDLEIDQVVEESRDSENISDKI